MGISSLKHYAKKAIEFTKEQGIAFTLNKVKRKVRNKYAYKKYIKSNMLTEAERQEQCNFNFSKFGDKGKTKFSIITPLYNTDVIFLKELIESVQAQTYANWELCLADGSENIQSGIRNFVEEVQLADVRIIYKKLDKNLGISGNTNAAIGLATGDYLAMLDHDDLLHPAALFENMKVICETGADVIYSDEMTSESKITNVKSIHFKPDFAIDNLRANNYICHLMVYKKELLDKVGLYNSEFDGSQDHDMILRLCEVTDRIAHIPRVLYYWRSHAGSVAFDVTIKPYVSKSGCSAVQGHLERVGLKGAVEKSDFFPAIYRIRYEIEGNPLVSIIISNQNHKEELERCINSIVEKSSYRNFEILILEKSSTENSSFEYYKELNDFEYVKIMKWEKEFNYAASNNYAARCASGDYLIFLNNNTEIIAENWIEEMLMYAQRNDVGAVGAKLYYSNDTIQHAGIILGITGSIGYAHRHWQRGDSGYMGRAAISQNLSCVASNCMMISRRKFEEVGKFDEDFKFYFYDVDLCLKLGEKGLYIVWTPYAELYYFGEKTRLEKEACFAKEMIWFKDKWAHVLKCGDSYYNKNLTKRYENFSIEYGDMTYGKN